MLSSQVMVHMLNHEYYFLVAYAAVHSSVYFGEPNLIRKLLLPYAYDTMIMQFYY